jgi:hypothetical protein
VAVRRGIWVPASLGPQPYDVRLVVYDPDTLAPLDPHLQSDVRGPTSDVAPPPTTSDLGLWTSDFPGGEAPIGGVAVTQSLATLPPGADAPYEPLGQRFGGGDDFDAIAFRGLRWVERDTMRAPLTVDLLWQLRGFSGTPHLSALSVVDERGRVWAQEARPLFGGTFNVKDWRNGETLAERRALDLGALPPGRYALTLALRNTDGRALPVDGKEGALRVAALTLPYRRPIGERAMGALRRYLPLLR